MKIIFVAIVFSAAVQVSPQQATRTIAVTIDDLPVVSTRSDLKNRREITTKLVGHITAAKIPAIGFVNEFKLYEGEKRDERQVDLLRMWLDAGLELGNHTFSHRSANNLDVKAYTADITRGEAVTKEILKAKNLRMRYFRHPFLQTGGNRKKRDAIYKFLADSGYTVAPVSFDNDDYVFSRAYDVAFDKNDSVLMKRIGEAYVPYMEAKLDYWERQSKKLFGREIAQTMLIHANFINSDYMDDLAAMMVKRGYKFVTLEEALKDQAYRLPDNYTGRWGISWLHRWALDRGKEFVLPDEPATPDFVWDASGLE